VDVERSQVVCPTSADDVRSFVENALGRNLANKGAADIVLLDQNIIFANEKVRRVSVRDFVIDRQKDPKNVYVDFA
jgi:hypothetical protein